MEKSKYYHATFMTTLLQLFNAILRNSNNDDKILDPATYAKFSKLSKTVFDSISTDEKDFSVTFVSVLIECWTAHFKQTNFIREHSHDIIETIYSRFTEGEIGVYGFANDETRIFTAQSFAIPYIAQVFEEQNALENLKGFVSDFGISFYEVKDSEVASSDKAILFKKEQVIPQVISDGKDISIIPFKAGDKLSWSVRWEPR